MSASASSSSRLDAADRCDADLRAATDKEADASPPVKERVPRSRSATPSSNAEDAAAGTVGSEARVEASPKAPTPTRSESSPEPELEGSGSGGGGGGTKGLLLEWSADAVSEVLAECASGGIGVSCRVLLDATDDESPLLGPPDGRFIITKPNSPLLPFAWRDSDADWTASVSF